MKHWLVLAAVLALSACAAAPPPPPPENPIEMAAVVGWLGTNHRTIFEITNVTDPDNPQVVLHQEGNLLGSCGVKNMVGLITGTTSMGAGSGAAGSLTQVCRGTNAASQQKVPCPYLRTGLAGGIKIGSARPGGCASSGLPWKCCTGTGGGCSSVSNTDVILFSEGQVTNDNTLVAFNYGGWLTGSWGSTADATELNFDAGYPKLFWNNGNLQGVQFQATAAASIANQQWCEYAVRSNHEAGCGAVSGNNPGTQSGQNAGWQLNHGVNTCVTKTNGEVWIATVTILFT